jgi:acetolactate synthase-1/2/3 large subunit
MNWGIDDALKIIRIDADPEALGKFSTPEIGLVGDAAPILEALLAALPPGAPDPALRDWIEAACTKAWQRLATLEPQRAWLQAMRDVLPEDGIFVDELTQLGYASRALFPVYAPRTFLSPGYQGTLGWGFSAGLGAQVAHPERKVLSVIGDGGFLFSVGELATAAQHNIPLVTVVVNDNAYGNVARIQDTEFGGRRIASQLNAPDFVKLAESFGVAAQAVDSPDALREALEIAFAADAPYLIEVKAAPMPDPWTMLRYKPSRGRAAR